MTNFGLGQDFYLANKQISISNVSEMFKKKKWREYES